MFFIVVTVQLYSAVDAVVELFSHAAPLYSGKGIVPAKAIEALIPKQSEITYTTWPSKYNTFCEYCKLHYTEDSVLVYVANLVDTESSKHKSMYSYVSGIKSALNNAKGINAKT